MITIQVTAAKLLILWQYCTLVWMFSCCTSKHRQNNNFFPSCVGVVMPTSRIIGAFMQSFFLISPNHQSDQTCSSSLGSH